MSENLRQLSELRLHPSFRSTEELLAACRADSPSKLLIDVDAEYTHRILALKSQLKSWRSIRQPSSSGSQKYDTASLCILQWLSASSSGHRITTLYPFLLELLPDIYEMGELLDNTELRTTAQGVLGAIANLPFPSTLIRPIMSTLINLLRTATSWRIRIDVLPVLQGWCIRYD